MEQIGYVHYYFKRYFTESKLFLLNQGWIGRDEEANLNWRRQVLLDATFPGIIYYGFFKLIVSRCDETVMSYE